MRDYILLYDMLWLKYICDIKVRMNRSNKLAIEMPLFL